MCDSSSLLDARRDALLPALRGAFDMRARGGALVLPGSPTAWYTAYDTRFMTVNPDGTGGAPVVGQIVGRVVDRTGNGYHQIQATAANRGVAQSGYLALSNPGFNFTNRFYSASSVPPGDRRSSSGIVVIDASALWAWFAPFTWTNANATAAPFPLRNCAVVWRANATEFAFWINGVKYSAAALTAGAVNALTVGAVNTFGRFYEYAYYSAALSDSEINALVAYGAARCNSASLSNNTILFDGDSITAGFGSQRGMSLGTYVSYLPAYRRYNIGVNGRLASQLTTGANINRHRSTGRNYVVIMAGTNDLANAVTPAATEALINTLCLRYRNSGYRVIVCTLLYRITGVSNANIDSTNALIRANALYNYADAICDVGARAELANPANTVYFTDGLHLADGGYEVWADEVQKTLQVLDADFAPQALAVVSGNALTMTDSTIATPTAWNWKVDGTTVSTVQNPAITFTGAGTKSLVLEATNANGATARRQRSIIVTSTLEPVVANKAFWFRKGQSLAAAWPDASGNSRTITYTGSPTINGSGTVTFGGTSHGKVAAFTFNQPLTIYLRMRLIGYGGTILDGNAAASMLFYMPGPSPTVSVFLGNISTDQITVGGWCNVVLGRLASGAETLIEANGVLSLSPTLLGNAGGFTLAADGNGGSRMNAEVAEVIGYTVPHNDAERSQCRQYLSSL